MHSLRPWPLILLLSCSIEHTPESAQPPTQAHPERFTELQPGLFLSDQGAWSAQLSDQSMQLEGIGEVELRFRSWGRLGAEFPLHNTPPSLAHRPDGTPSVERSFANISEWWTAGKDKVEQGWTVATAPAGSGPLILTVEVDAELLRVAPDHAILRDSFGGIWRYDDLCAWGATGTPLKIVLEEVQAGLQLVIDDAGARYPLTIDPILAPDETILFEDLSLIHI